MKLIKYNENQLADIIKRSEEDINKIIPTVNDILVDIKENKDKAILGYTEKFDGVKLEDMKVSEEEIKEAYNNIDDKLIEALKSAASNIEKFHKAEIPKEWKMDIKDGITAGQIIRPLETVGCYIPGGRAAYPSTILMTVIPAKIAGVKKIVCCTPPGKDGKVMDAILVASDIAGADEIYKVGGAQAIGAMAYGSETIPKVDKIVGPGNIFVTGAKKLVYGDVDIEFPAGPSELLVLADETDKAEFIAYDIMSQAEHDPNAACIFVTPSEELAHEVEKEIKEKTEKAVRKEIIEASLSKRGKIVIVDDIDEGIYVTNKYAPEHLIISTKDNEYTLSKINNAGSIFLGNYSPVACGDYGSGTNHVLPTGAGARMYSGLSTEDFLKKPTVQKITKDGLNTLKETILPIAEYEGFFAHADSVKIRFKE
ncbi:histidinol dehydrogenase [Methanobrevibacter sp. 87.7]|uniref:histidinol dehydrogenase n=1 Tax=Methanobrevibacter sp. 87.7 TaxID=387957 RepID=UPI000B50B699|nr:histidinol dehydrogenase [Methanobrevibacter sp. 87.7]OWT32401.1 histidinol dehydrogenase [Methanobrevibacter sp. 87.7]